MVMGSRGAAVSRMILDKQQRDESLAQTDRSLWYSVSTESLSADLCSTFVLSQYDQTTDDFLTASSVVSNSVCWQLYYGIASTFFSYFMSKTSINGLLNRGQMFVFSTKQLRHFLGDELLSVCPEGFECAVLDLGAGDGTVTAMFEPLFPRVYVTEPSMPMQYRLSQRGYELLGLDTWQNTARDCQLLSALNLLDRHPAPLQLLRQLHLVASESGALVLLAFVLPFSQFSEFSKNIEQRLSFKSRTFEGQLQEMQRFVLEQAGFEIVKWTKLPYLCQGDSVQAYYLLSDVLLLLRAVPFQH